MSVRGALLFSFVACLIGGGVGAWLSWHFTKPDVVEATPTPTPTRAERPVQHADEAFDMPEAMVLRELSKDGNSTTESAGLPVLDAHRAIQASWELHEQRLLEAADPVRYKATLRERIATAREQLDVSALAATGEFLFQYDLGAWAPTPRKLRRVHRGAHGGPDAFRCSSCHWVPVRGGAGGLADNTFFDGDGSSTTSALVRNPPALFGAGLMELIASEMTNDMQAAVEAGAERARAMQQQVQVELITKGVSFGSVTVHANGYIDRAEVIGVDPDLVVKPFGWKGTTTTVRDAVVEALELQLGLDEQTAGTGVIESLVAFVVMLEPPASLPPWLADHQLRWETGRKRFETMGCAKCHVPYLILENPTYRIGDMEVDLASELGLVRDDAAGGWRVWLYSDLRRHSMGEGLADHHTFLGIARDEFQTPALWGMDGSAPYLHDGRGFDSIDTTLAQHGGEAATSGETFLEAPVVEQAEIRLFLRTLSRNPQMRVMGP